MILTFKKLKYHARCLTFFAFCFILGSFSYAQKNKLEYSSEYPLYLSDGSKYSYNEIDVALEKVFSYDKPVVLLVHGRGNEPNKSLNGGFFVEGKAVHKLEKQYGAKVLLFNWNSNSGFFDRNRPLNNMPSAANSFSIILEHINEYLKKSYNKRISLLVHSMGSIVIQNYIETYGWKFKEKIFNNVLFTSADCDNKNHAEWMDKISMVEKVYITINKNDFVLSISLDARKNGNRALGKKPILPLSKFATYLDLTRLGKKVNRKIRSHEIFNKKSMLDQVNICETMRNIITSTDPDLAKNAYETSVPGYYKFKFYRDSHDPCFNLKTEEITSLD